MKRDKLLLIAQIILFLGFLFFGAGKFLTSPEEAIGIFGNIGGEASQYFTGVYEITSAILVIIPVTSFIGALMIAISMIVAIILHFTIIGVNGLVIVAIIFLLIAIYVMKETLPKTFKKDN